jgi:hypothetical protein
LQRLEILPTLQADLADSRSELEKESKGRVFAEQQAAVLGSKLEAATDRAIKAETAAMETTAQAIKTAEAASQEAAKTESALSTIANLRGKVDRMQEQIQQQIHELATARQAEIKATEEAAELRGKFAANFESVCQQQTP